MPNNSPISQYQRLVKSNKIRFDDTQQHAIEFLQQIYLTLHPTKISVGSVNSIEHKSLYLWGKVGRGKTFLMDLLVNSLPDSLCRRQHFHHFMQNIHAQLTENYGQPEPLKLIAEKLSSQFKVLCFDEFFVSDIGDAMILGNLLQYMFELKMIVVCTSNCAPQMLYKNGLQRDRFLPAIAAIERNANVVHLNGQDDHRLRALTYVQNYFELPRSLEKQIELHQRLLHRFKLTSVSRYGHSSNNLNSDIHDEPKISILGRDIYYIAKNNDERTRAICFDFDALCSGPRSHFDYVEIAKMFDNILLFNVPPMSGQGYERIKARGTEDSGLNITSSTTETGEREVILAPMDDAVRRFVALVDECYDSHTNLVVTAYVPQHELYTNGTLMFEFERTKSRLIEMASQEFLDSVGT